VFQFFSSESGNGKHADCGASIFMGKGNFEAIREARKINFQMSMLAGQMLKGFEARFDDRGLQPSDGVALQTGRIRQKTRYAARRGRQPRVGVNAHMQVLGFSGHGS
jgi:hypothetical protein